MAASAELVGLLGDELQGKSGKVSTASALAGAEVVGLYFSAHWCGPCRHFTPQLIESYKAVKAANKALEIVFVSSDRDDAAFAEYYGEMPWLALPFADRERKAALSRKYGVNGIPTLVLLGADGSVRTKNGRGALGDAAEAVADFPYLPASARSLLGDALIGADGAPARVADLAGKVVGLYFSAHWCGPCRHFTPQLIERYKTARAAGKPFEIIFCSGDNSDEEFREYFGTMPWLALPYGDARIEKLNAHFEVEGIPTLVLLDGELNTLNRDGREALAADASCANYPWPWKPTVVADLADTAQGINEVPALIAHVEGVSNADEVVAALHRIAQPTIDKCLATKEDPDMVLFYAKGSGGVVDQICRLTKVPLEAGKARLVLLDIPDNGGFYVREADDAPLTEATIRAFLDDYRAKKLERKQLSRG